MSTVAWAVAAGSLIFLLLLTLALTLCKAAAAGDRHLADIDLDNVEPVELADPINLAQVNRDSADIDALARGEDIPGGDELARAAGVWRDRCRAGTEQPDRAVIQRLSRAAQWAEQRDRWGWS